MVDPQHILDSGFLLIDDQNRIAKVGVTTPSIKSELQSDDELEIIECDVLCPGLIDLHTHGVGGHQNVLWYYKNPQYTASRLPRFGTTSFLSTVVFSNESMDDVISMCRHQLTPFIQQIDNNQNGAICEGIHCEGPIIADFGGLPNSDQTLKWDIDRFASFLDELGDAVKVMTISPSIDALNDFKRIQLLQSKGIIAALGHDRRCTEKEIIRILSMSANSKSDSMNHPKYSALHFTHCFNVQKFHHREPGLANFALTPKCPNLPKYRGITRMPTIEVIGDLCHITPLLIESILRAHSPDYLDRICFITDGIAESVADQEVLYNESRIRVDGEGLTVKNEEGVLCGSCCNMLSILRNLMNVFGVDIANAVGMCSTNAAKRLGMENEIGTLEEGTRADMILMDNDLNLLVAIVNGKAVYRRDKCRYI